jgi:hypothetical protein
MKYSKIKKTLTKINASLKSLFHQRRQFFMHLNNNKKPNCWSWSPSHDVTQQDKFIRTEDLKRPDGKVPIPIPEHGVLQHVVEDPSLSSEYTPY